MRVLFVVAAVLIGGSGARAETAPQGGWKLGLDFEQQVYVRQGLRLEKVDAEAGSSIGVTIGSQSPTTADSDGKRHSRKVVDYGAYYIGGISITPVLKSRVGVQAGYMAFHNGTSTSTTGASYFDVVNGLAVSYGKIDFFTDLAMRFWLFGTDKDLVMGDRRLESSYVYPRLGFNVAI